MKSALLKAIAAVMVLMGIVAAQECSARGTAKKSIAPPAILTQNVQSSSSLNDSSLPLFSCGAAAAIWTGDTPTSSAIPLGLAVADFTGDSHPDLATLELDRLDSSNAYYFIEIQLTEGGHQSLRLTAPARGLVITPKDVTGDGTLDLVVRAVGSEVPVAVFLNDGCGHFSAREPAPFARAIPGVPTESEFTSTQRLFGAAVIAPGSYPLACRDGSWRPLHEQRSSPPSANNGAPSRLFSPFGSNRAPPAAA